MRPTGDPISSPTYDFVMGIAAFRGYDGVTLKRLPPMHPVKQSRKSRKRKRRTKMKLV